MALVCQLVDTISATPALRLDLNSKPWLTHKDTRFEYPPLRHVIASTMMTDGAEIPASAYGLRTLHLVLQVNTPTVDETATELQKLVRELNRPWNLLKTQMGTAPVFFETHRSSPDDWQIHTDGAFMTIVADVLAKPFALGLREDPVVLQTVNTNPAAGNLFLDVTGVKGDVETPAYIRWPAAGITSNDESVFAVRRRGTPGNAPFLFQAEALTQGTNTTTQVNDGNFSGAGNNYSRCTFTTATLSIRLSTTDIGTAGVDLRGRYRVYLRYRKNTSTDGINLQLQHAAGWVLNKVWATPNVTSITTADLGEVSIPAGRDPVVDPSGVEIPASDVFSFQLWAERTSGAGTIDFDFFLFVPADDRMAIVKWPADLAGADRYYLDARDHSVHSRDASDQIAGVLTPTVAGGLPMLSPGQTNRIYMLRQVQSAAAYDLTTVTNVSVSYMPRYLSVRPAST